MGRRAARDRGGTPATAALSSLALPYAVRSYRHDPSAGSYGSEAAEALGVDARRVFKTLLADTGQALVVGIVPVTAQLDLKALAAAVGAKRVVMADAAAAERATGYVVGGISPIGQRRRHTTVVDESALEWPTVMVSGGRRGFEIELSPTALLTATGATIAPIAR